MELKPRKDHAAPGKAGRPPDVRILAKGADWRICTFIGSVSGLVGN
jgi:hypothetical protein